MKGTFEEWLTYLLWQVQDVNTLQNVADDLLKNNIQFKLWIEQPENFATCLATKPYYKPDVEKYFKQLKLFK